MNQYSWRICTKQLKLKPWCIACKHDWFQKSGGAEAPLSYTLELQCIQLN